MFQIFGASACRYSTRGNEALRVQLPGRPAMTFVRADNAASLRAHRKMGMQELGAFLSDGVPHIAFTYTGAFRLFCPIPNDDNDGAV